MLTHLLALSCLLVLPHLSLPHLPVLTLFPVLLQLSALTQLPTLPQLPILPSLRVLSALSRISQLSTLCTDKKVTFQIRVIPKSLEPDHLPSDNQHEKGPMRYSTQMPISFSISVMSSV